MILHVFGEGFVLSSTFQAGATYLDASRESIKVLNTIYVQYQKPQKKSKSKRSKGN